tara:strand:- start:158 stop:286 length:129 start_codon:yes stop_codon:yes gene_type:complete
MWATRKGLLLIKKLIDLTENKNLYGNEKELFRKLELVTNPTS